MAMSNAKRRMKEQRSVELVPDEDKTIIPRRLGRHRKSSTSRKPKKFR